MKGITEELQSLVSAGLKSIFSEDAESHTIVINQTKKEFEGDYTIVLFPFVKRLKKSPKDIGDALLTYLQENSERVTGGSLVSGFLNVSVSDQAWKDQLALIAADQTFGESPENGKSIMVEFSSPNTNKPLHLGHIRNILLGHACANIYAAAGYKVIQTQIINDRGIAVCKSMYAWNKFGNNTTPATENIKGDHFVGNYYVKYNNLLADEYTAWQATDEAKAVFKEKAKEGTSEQEFFGKETKEMLLKWEAGDKDTVDLWKKLNGWVYDGFDETYSNLGVEFTKNYYESDTYLLGRKAVEEHLEKGLFFKKPDGSIWVDLEDIGMDQKILLRADGTSLYMTQDIGTANIRYAEFKPDKMIYVVGNEQDYHFKVLFEVMKRMGAGYAEGMYHLSYGMVELPTGKMKSREGKVVDADDLMAEVITEAANSAKESDRESGRLGSLSEEAQNEIFRRVGMGALKYQLIRVNPRKGMIFDPKDSVDMHGVTGPYIQNGFVRIQSVLNRLADESITSDFSDYQLFDDEKELIITMSNYPNAIKEAADNYDPSLIANYSYNLAKTFHRFYNERSILKAESDSAKVFRKHLINEVAKVLEKSMGLLGIEMPERM
ncbi:UNVERIFIED_CONTAM: hypothetical protein GTU68_047608 [Idotea baltica]|nr:hypothetical protein [Idotea baltica]